MLKTFTWLRKENIVLDNTPKVYSYDITENQNNNPLFNTNNKYLMLRLRVKTWFEKNSLGTCPIENITAGVQFFSGISIGSIKPGQTWESIFNSVASKTLPIIDKEYIEHDLKVLSPYEVLHFEKIMQQYPFYTLENYEKIIVATQLKYLGTNLIGQVETSDTEHTADIELNTLIQIDYVERNK